MVVPAPLADLRHPAYRWQTVFCHNGAACRLIDAERHTARHSGNSFDASQQISADRAASFSQHRRMR
jgi:hypothetical protein